VSVINPMDALSVISVHPDCPAQLVFVVKWVKAMVKFKEIHIESDVDFNALVDFFHNVVNSGNWPAFNLFNLTMSKDVVKDVLLKAREWIYYKEVV